VKWNQFLFCCLSLHKHLLYLLYIYFLQCDSDSEETDSASSIDSDEYELYEPTVSLNITIIYSETCLY
jgi:hypothetical protein